ncbi:MAG: hypothetical protein COA98_05765 [Candidatus Neomarinimicrobiota bacterium]|nr:MAG: hypothetical protein COA98_05765 [Candidatus Neomarinimicrobiota bacterium]
MEFISSGGENQGVCETKANRCIPKLMFENATNRFTALINNHIVSVLLTIDLQHTEAYKFRFLDKKIRYWQKFVKTNTSLLNSNL